MKKVIITGATSMLGLALIKKCISEKVAVIAIMRENSRKKNLLPLSPFIKIAECSLENIKSLKLLENDCDCLFHFAWEFTDKEGRNDPVKQEKNVGETLDCVRLAKSAGCKAFVFAGSQAEYGRVQGIIGPDKPANPDIAYGAAKYAAGSLSKMLCNSYGIRHIYTRIFSVYGPNDTEISLVSYALRNMLDDKDCAFTKCGQIWDYLYCGDCAEALFLLVDKGKNNTIYNIGSGEARRLKEFVEIMRECTKTKSTINYGAVPYSENQVMHLEADISNLAADTGFKPAVSFKEGITRTIEYIKENHGN